MKVSIVQGPGNAAAHISLQANESCVAEGGSLVAMRGLFSVETATHARKRSIMRGLKRMLGGESFFQNYYSPLGTQGEIILAASLPGDLRPIELDGVGIIAEGGSFLARAGSVELDTSWQGMKSFLSGEGVFWLRLTGSGQVILNSFGAIYPIDIDGDYIVDTGHIVAFEETLNFTITKAGRSWLSSFLGGEGFVCKFSGRGRLWCQSHNAPAFGRILTPMLRAR